MSSVRFPAIRAPKWPNLNLGEHLADTIQAYSRAISVAYLSTLGLDADATPARKRNHWDIDR
jgi:hypothetical protein